MRVVVAHSVVRTVTSGFAAAVALVASGAILHLCIELGFAAVPASCGNARRSSIHFLTQFVPFILVVPIVAAQFARGARWERVARISWVSAVAGWATVLLIAL